MFIVVLKSDREVLQLLSSLALIYASMQVILFSNVVIHKNMFLKVPKREIFDGSDFPDFYTIKSLRVGDFGVNIKINFKNI